MIDALPTQIENDERRFGVTSDWAVMAALGLAVAIGLWAVLFAAYRLDRADAVALASATVLLVVPPLVSYCLVMELAKNRWSLAWRIGATYGLALAWLAVQRDVVSPAFGFVSSIGESVANFVLLPTFGIALWLAARSVLYRRRLARALELQTQTELRLLQAQLAPHTLFNMLNTVYSVLLTDHRKAIPLFLSMSEVLRHVVDRTREPWIPLHDELAFIEHHAALERARHPERVTITVRAMGDLDVPVPPMLLATLFENALKHGRFPDGTLEVDVSVDSGETEIRFEVSNRFPFAGRPMDGMGVGLSSVKNRLTLLYPEKSWFDASASGDRYRAAVRIAL
jgi:hypothetical protein